MSATAIRSLHPENEQHHDRRGRVMVADHDGFARRLIQNALQADGGVLTLPAAKAPAPNSGYAACRRHNSHSG